MSSSSGDDILALLAKKGYGGSGGGSGGGGGGRKSEDRTDDDDDDDDDNDSNEEEEETNKKKTKKGTTSAKKGTSKTTAKTTKAKKKNGVAEGGDDNSDDENDGEDGDEEEEEDQDNDDDEQSERRRRRRQERRKASSSSSSRQQAVAPPSQSSTEPEEPQSLPPRQQPRKSSSSKSMEKVTAEKSADKHATEKTAAAAATTAAVVASDPAPTHAKKIGIRPSKSFDDEPPESVRSSKQSLDSKMFHYGTPDDFEEGDSDGGDKSDGKSDDEKEPGSPRESAPLSTNDHANPDDREEGAADSIPVEQALSKAAHSGWLTYNSKYRFLVLNDAELMVFSDKQKCRMLSKVKITNAVIMDGNKSNEFILEVDKSSISLGGKNATDCQTWMKALYCSCISSKDDFSHIQPDKDSFLDSWKATTGGSKSQSKPISRRAKELTVVLDKPPGEFLGLDVRVDKTGTVITSIVEDGAAAKSGELKINDRIKMINESNVEGWTLDMVVEKMRGLKGTINLVILRT